MKQSRFKFIIFAVIGCLTAITTFLFLSGVGIERTYEVVYVIEYTGSYNVTITENGDATMSERLGNIRGTLTRRSDDEWIISIYARKFDDSTNLLTVKVMLPDGTILKEDNTFEPFGEAHVSILFR